MRRRIRLSESELKRVIGGRVRKMLNEYFDYNNMDFHDWSEGYDEEYDSMERYTSPDGFTWIIEKDGCGVVNWSKGMSFDTVDEALESGMKALRRLFSDGCGGIDLFVLDSDGQSVYLVATYNGGVTDRRRLGTDGGQRSQMSESQLRRIVAKSVRKVLNEAGRPPLVTRSGEFPFVRKGDLPELSDDDAAELRSELDKLDSNFGKWSGLDTDMPVVVVGGEYEGEYTLGDVVRDLPVVGFEGPSNNRRLGMRTAGLPRIKGYVGPMIDGDRIRYESQEANDFFSI